MFSRMFAPFVNMYFRRNRPGSKWKWTVFPFLPSFPSPLSFCQGVHRKDEGIEQKGSKNRCFGGNPHCQSLENSWKCKMEIRILEFLWKISHSFSIIGKYYMSLILCPRQSNISIKRSIIQMEFGTIDGEMPLFVTINWQQTLPFFLYLTFAITYGFASIEGRTFFCLTIFATFPLLFSEKCKKQ